MQDVYLWYPYGSLIVTLIDPLKGTLSCLLWLMQDLYQQPKP